jgi:hypothetical protein
LGSFTEFPRGEVNQMFVLYDFGLLGLLALAFAIGFGAGFWSALGSVGLIVRFILLGISDRRPIPHHEEVGRNGSGGYGLDKFIPVLSWPKMWRWTERKDKGSSYDQKDEPEREV